MPQPWVNLNDSEAAVELSHLFQIKETLLPTTKQMKTCLDKLRGGNPKDAVKAGTAARQSENGQKKKGIEPG